MPMELINIDYHDIILIMRIMSEIKRGVRESLMDGVVNPMSDRGQRARLEQLVSIRKERRLGKDESAEFKTLGANYLVLRFLAGTTVGRKVTDWLADN